MDFRRPADENDSVPTPRSTPVPSRFRSLLALLLAATIGGTGCDRVKDALRREPAVDTRWQGDSATLAANPLVLFHRYSREDGRTRIIPMAAIGDGGFRPLEFAGRGWRLFDLEYLQRGKQLTALRDGRAAGTVTMQRGMWEPTAIDTFPGCDNPSPAGMADVPQGVTLLTNRPPNPLNPVTPLSAGELAEVLARVPTLVAPTLGVGSGLLASRYKREVHVANTGVTSRPTVIVIYDDPEVVPDSVDLFTERPRHLVVILDRGVYGYRPSYTLKTVGNGKSPFRLRFKDYADLDGDGRAELMFSLRPRETKDLPAEWELVTSIMRFEGEAWREQLRWLRVRCGF